MFTCRVAADVFGEKLNLELNFPGPPSVPQLTQQVAQAFAAEVELRRPAAAPRGFDPAAFQVHDERRGQWVDLVDAAQLTAGCQLYAFQPPSQWHQEVQAPIPAARPPRAPLPPPPAAASVPRGAPPARPSGPAPQWPEGLSALSAAAGGCSGKDATHAEKARDTFAELDANRSSAVERQEWHDALNLLNLPLSVQQSDALFTKADVNGDGRISWAEWQVFSETYPSLLDSLYFRFAAHWEDHRAQSQVAAAAALANMRRDAEATAARALDEAKQDVGRARERLTQRADAVAVGEHELRECAARRDHAAAAAAQAARVRDDFKAKHESSRQSAARAAQDEAEAAQQVEERGRYTAAPKEECAAAEQQVLQAKQDLAQAARKVAECDQMVASARADVQRAKEAMQNAAEALVQARGRAAASQDAAAEGDAVCSALQQRERSAAAQQEAIAREVAAAREALRSTERGVADAREEEAAALSARVAAERAREQQQLALQQAVGRNDAFAARRSEMEQSELPLLHQEVQLRMQRDSLEEEEAALARQQRDFYDAAWQQTRSAAVR
eukprot:TRINITY_DN62346_c0_g1_i1.p1 TRINITY_DN62346_c0_g1~~TRINITY_DN62346_c0_g1_i1.p1  ORF type:complete len:560 (+),score=191.18 TRINITY_DN62346_c0_g1_i1:77-1756(+)